jgi:hypothetical protein
MNRPTMLHCALIEEILSQHGLPANLDVATLQRRVENEGEGFLTLTLPELGAALEAALESGRLLRSMCPSFGHNKRETLPRFLGGLFRLIFSEDGCLLDNADPDAIYGIRQICNWYKKPKAPCSASRSSSALNRYLSIEEDLVAYTNRCQTISFDPVFRRISDIIWRTAFYGFSPDDIICWHGPGSTAERLMLNERQQIRAWPLRSEQCFPVADHAIPNFSHHHELENIEFIAEDQEPPVRVVFVPKTMKTPRVIAIEPSHMQYMQQGLLRYMVNSIESCFLTRKTIRFSDQSINRSNAQSASLSRDYATIDMSDASDRVHNELVKSVFHGCVISDYLQACRSLRAQLPNAKAPVTLLKFASMGSATCFPVEAMVFYTVIQYSLHKHFGLTPSYDTISNFSDRIDVYGDDIIVPSNVAGVVIEDLESFGLRVNRRKSFVEGNFRESCGGDYYKGTDVTPVYLRHRLPTFFNNRCDPTVLESLAKTSDQLYLKGLWKTCQLLRDWVQQLARTKIPRSRYAGSGIRFLSRLFCTDLRWHSATQGFAQKRLVLVPSKALDPCTYLGSLNKVFRSSGEQQLNFDFSVKRGVFKVKRRWIPALIGLETTL